ncbi:conserved hypothetical protein [Cellulomonas flavigena DSM 20109]|uniref:NTP pyrophosphohydrolase n=1 Tax=Cellulomonas flavigena (strain ATCC 482 / DSM 20109 / BCRC 11376 / JCM 18109 / NBRC 3775 / NCIMB 8073 / NRS 134) TaxID=446466 RepID=D5UCJ8_CELFN|nr:conserved hypothetical protein [Cellulomonas flavigena DSM 20109]
MAATAATDVVLVVDAANVVGSRPDGWWRDRAGAAARLLDRLAGVVATTAPGPDGGDVRLARVEVVLEGRARDAAAPAVPGLVVHRAPHDGDTEVVRVAEEVDAPVLVVTADQGLRMRLGDVRAVGPGWLLALLDPAR